MVVGKRKYLLITAMILTITVFLGGIALGWTLDHYRADELLENIKQSELITESLIVEESFIDHYGGDRCELLSSRVYDLQQQSRVTGKQLSEWGEGDTFQTKDFDYLKRKYILLEIRFFILLNDLKNECNSDYNTILFFYQKDQEQSIQQGFILDELSDNYDNLIVLSIDKDYTDEPLVELLRSKYGITKAPTLIINKVKFEGFTSKAQIESAIK